MRWLNVEVRALEELRLPPEWGERIEDPRNRDFAAVLKQTDGPIHFPVVELATMEVVSGLDRLAALFLGGHKKFAVRMWSGSPAEKKLIRASENAHRRRDAAESRKWLADYLEAKREALAERKAEDTGTPVPPERVTKDDVRAEVGRELGIKGESVRKREQRDRKRESAGTDVPPPVVKPVPKPPSLRSRIDAAYTTAKDLQVTVRELAEELREPANRSAESWRAMERPRKPGDASIENVFHALDDAASHLDEARRLIGRAHDEQGRLKANLRRAGQPSKRMRIEDEHGNAIELEQDTQGEDDPPDGMSSW